MSEGSTPTVEDQLFDLLDRLDVSESIDLEYKECQRKIPGSLWPTVSAFANTSGGAIVLGVAEVGDQLVLSGVVNASRVQQELVDQLRNRQKISFDVCGSDGVQRHRVAGVDVIIIRVGAVPLRDRPVYLSGNVYDGTYVRRNSGDFRATKAEVDRMMRQASPIAGDALIVAGSGLSDLDQETLRRYRQRHLLVNQAAPRNGYDDLRFLRAINGYGTDEMSGREGLTVAGLLMFGTEESIRQWRSRHLIDFRLEEMESVARWDDRVVWEGNLFTAFELIYPRLIQDLPLPFELDGPYRVQEGRLQIALREALINLLVHADYAERGASLIKRTPQRFLFRNPGASLIRHLDPDADDQNDPRNPGLVRMFRFIGLADEAGSGLPKIFQAWRESDLRPPLIDPGRERYEFSLQLEFLDMLSPQDRDWLADIGVSPSREERLALIHARNAGMVDNLSLRTVTGLHAFDATRILTRLRDAGYLTKEGTRRNAWYQLGPKAALAEDRAYLPKAARSLEDSNPDVPTNAANLPRNDPSLQGTDTPGLQGTDTPSLRAIKTDSVDARLMAIAAPIRAMKRMPASQTERIIRDLCVVRPLTRNEIARWIDRSGPHTSDLVRVLVDRGTLVMTNPDKPNDPNQRYRGVSNSSERQGTVDG